MAEFPRLLVATEFPPNASGGGPAVVRQMLRQYPAEKIYWWSVFPDLDSKFGQKVAAHEVARIPAKWYPQRKYPLVKSWALEKLWVPWASNHLKKTLRKVNPEAIWIIPHNWSIPPLSQTLSSAVPFHISIQDYVNIHDHPSRFGEDRCKNMESQLDHLYSSARTRDVISAPMQIDLKQRTGFEADQILRAGLEEEDFLFLKNSQSSSQQKIKIAYAGSILVPETFEIFVRALATVRKKLSSILSLELFGAHSYQNYSWFDSSWMNEHGNLNEEDLKKSLRECTWGFCPMSLTDSNPNYNRFSLPTKFSTYLASGLPVLTIGHETSSVMNLARIYNPGFSSSTDDPAILAEELLNVLSEPSPRERFRNAILECAVNEFDAAKMRDQLMASLSQL